MSEKLDGFLKSLNVDEFLEICDTEIDLGNFLAPATITRAMRGALAKAVFSVPANPANPIFGATPVVSDVAGAIRELGRRIEAAMQTVPGKVYTRIRKELFVDIGNKLTREFEHMNKKLNDILKKMEG